jgi:hypothetical protein
MLNLKDRVELFFYSRSNFFLAEDLFVFYIQKYTKVSALLLFQYYISRSGSVLYYKQGGVYQHEEYTVDPFVHLGSKK